MKLCSTWENFLSLSDMTSFCVLLHHEWAMILFLEFFSFEGEFNMTSKRNHHQDWEDEWLTDEYFILLIICSTVDKPFLFHVKALSSVWQWDIEHLVAEILRNIEETSILKRILRLFTVFAAVAITSFKLFLQLCSTGTWNDEKSWTCIHILYVRDRILRQVSYPDPIALEKLIYGSLTFLLQCLWSYFKIH